MQYTLPPDYECVLDLRALARLPANPDDDGVHSFRAIFMQKGRTVHVPDEPGCYATTSPYRIQTAVCIVHFHESTKREDELLLTFVDYGMLSVDSSSTGVYVMSLQLPLQKARNVYEETPRFAPIGDVAGFSHIKTNQQPWCALLKPALERQPMLAQLQIFCAMDVVHHIKTSLGTRLQTLHDLAVEDIQKLVADLGRQDARAAEKMKVKYGSRLAATMEFFKALPPNKYDRAMKERIIMLEADSKDVQWLRTPVRENLRKGTAHMNRTAQRRVHFGGTESTQGKEAEPEVEPEVEPEAEGAGEELSDGFEDLPETESEQPNTSKASNPPPRRRGSKRARTAPVRLDSAPPPAGKKTKKGAAKPETQVHACALTQFMFGFMLAWF